MPLNDQWIAVNVLTEKGLAYAVAIFDADRKRQRHDARRSGGEEGDIR